MTIRDSCYLAGRQRDGAVHSIHRSSHQSWPPLSIHLAERVGHLGDGDVAQNTKEELATCGALSKFLEVLLCM